MPSDFQAVQPQYPNIAELFGQIENIKNARMQRELMQAKSQEYARKNADQERLRGLYSGGQSPTFEQAATIDPEYAMEAERLNIGRRNAASIEQRNDQDLFKQAANNAMIRWKATGNNPDAWPAVIHDVRRQLQTMTSGRLGNDANIEKFTPEMVSQFAGYQDPDVLAQQKAKAEAMQAGAKARAELPSKVVLEGFKLENKPSPQPRPMNPLEEQLKQAQIEKIQNETQSKAEKLSAEKNAAISNIDDTIADFEELKNIQGRTHTGPISGSAPIAMIRKALPNEISGGEDLQRLEKGYNTLAVKAIGAFRAGGVTFGQLSNKEGEWVRSTQQTIDTGGNINQEMLDKGLRLLQERKARIESHGKPNSAMSNSLGTPQPETQQTRIVQRNKRTGAIRYSTDGGITWTIE